MFYRTNRSKRSGAIWLMPLFITMAVVAVFGASTRGAEIDQEKAAGVKAAYLRHLAAYFTWPDAAFDGDAEPIVIAVVGDDPYRVADILSRAIREKNLRANGRSLRVERHAYVRPTRDGDSASAIAKRIAFVESLRGSHLAFFTRSVRDNLDDLRSIVANRPIGTVSEIAGFATSGGMVEFLIAERDDDKAATAKLNVNLGAIRDARMRLSARLLGLRRVVRIVESNGVWSGRGGGR